MENYYKEFDNYAFKRHKNALDLGFKHIGKDNYELPANWGKEGIIIDLSATGNDQLQIVKSSCMQMISIINLMNCQKLELS